MGASQLIRGVLRTGGTTLLASLIAVAVLAGLAGPREVVIPGDHDLWELSGPPTSVRWLVIHNLAEGKKTGVYHVEVLERARAAPRWRFKRLAAHLAVTEAALRASVRRPLRSGRVYPEQFEEAYAKWRKEHAGGLAAVCDSTIVGCLETK